SPNPAVGAPLSQPSLDAARTPPPRASVLPPPQPYPPSSPDPSPSSLGPPPRYSPFPPPLRGGSSPTPDVLPSVSRPHHLTRGPSPLDDIKQIARPPPPPAVSPTPKLDPNTRTSMRPQYARPPSSADRYQSPAGTAAVFTATSPPPAPTNRAASPFSVRSSFSAAFTPPTLDRGRAVSASSFAFSGRSSVVSVAATDQARQSLSRPQHVSAVAHGWASQLDLAPPPPPPVGPETALPPPPSTRGRLASLQPTAFRALPPTPDSLPPPPVPPHHERGRRRTPMTSVYGGNPVQDAGVFGQSKIDLTRPPSREAQLAEEAAFLSNPYAPPPQTSPPPTASRPPHAGRSSWRPRSSSLDAVVVRW
ncbi:hypothetical protein HK405_013310, partial [Cladochytrium tenue]